MIDDITFIAQISIKSSVAVLLATIGEIITDSKEEVGASGFNKLV